MFSQKDVIDLWESDAYQEYEKNILLAAMIAETTKDYNLKCVLVGGAATEIYTHRNYATADLDFIMLEDESENEVMKQLGFEKCGKDWSCPETGFSVEFPRGPLDGDWGRVVPISTDFGIINVIGLEDIIIDRCCRRYNWGNFEFYDKTDEFAWRTTDEVVYYLLASNSEDLDWNYLDRRAIETGCEPQLVHYKKHYKHILGEIDDRNPQREALQKTDEFNDYLNSLLSSETTASTAKQLLIRTIKDLNLLSDASWSEEKDLVLLRYLVKRGIPFQKIKKVMLYSPGCYNMNNLNRTVKIRKLYKKITSKNIIK